MAATSVVARVRALLERATRGALSPAEHAALISDAGELRARLARLEAMGLGDVAQLSPELEALVARAHEALAAPATAAG